MSATPRPWRFQREITREHGNPEITTWPIYTKSGLYGHPAVVFTEEDAELIVRAVNLFDELVGVCHDVINASESPMGAAYELPRVQAYARGVLARAKAELKGA